MNLTVTGYGKIVVPSASEMSMSQDDVKKFTFNNMKIMSDPLKMLVLVTRKKSINQYTYVASPIILHGTSAIERDNYWMRASSNYTLGVYQNATKEYTDMTYAQILKKATEPLTMLSRESMNAINNTIDKIRKGIL